MLHQKLVHLRRPVCPQRLMCKKNAVILSVMKAGVLKIGARLKRPSAEPAPKVNQARVDVAPSPASAPIR
jgi:hypothetical protein